MKAKLAGLILGVGAGFVVSLARLSDPAIIREMFLLRSPHVFLVMGSAVAIAAVGVRLLRAAGVRAFITGDAIGWSVEPARSRHVAGSALFAAGWSVAGTCPGPVAAMIGEGKLAGLVVAGGLVVGVALQRAWALRRAVCAHARQPMAPAL